MKAAYVDHRQDLLEVADLLDELALLYPGWLGQALRRIAHAHRRQAGLAAVLGHRAMQSVRAAGRAA